MPTDNRRSTLLFVFPNPKQFAMNPIIGWTLAVIGTALGYYRYGWPGVALCVSVVVFWLLLQFSKAVRAMRVAGQSPVGVVPSAVMLHSKLRKGMRLMQIILHTRSLGAKVREVPEVWRWTDGSGASVVVTLVNGRCTGWTLERPPQFDAPVSDSPVPDSPISAA